MAQSSDPLLTAAKRWQRRINIGTSAGYNPAAIQAVQQADLRKVGMGGSGLSDQEALAAMQSAATGQTSQQKKPSSSIAGIPGRMVADVGSMLTGLAVGGAHLIEHPGRDIKGAARGIGETIHEVAGNPSVAWDQAHGYERTQGSSVMGNLGEAFRNIEKTPVGRFVPGMLTASEASTPQGRKEAMQHPGFVAADLLPYAHGIVTNLARMGALGDVAERGTAAEAAAKGQVAKTTLRAASEGLRKLTGGRYGLGLPTINNLLNEYGATRLASQTIGRFHDWAKNLNPEDKSLAWELHVESHPLYRSLYDPSHDPLPEEDPMAGARADWRQRRGELQVAADNAAQNYENIAAAHASYRPPEAQPELPAQPIHPEAQTAAAPATWHEVSKLVRPDAPFELSRTGPEGWYLKQKGVANSPELLVKRVGYEQEKAAVEGPTRTAPAPPDPAELERAHVASRTAVQALHDHIANEPPRPEIPPQPLSPAQETLRKVWESGGPAGPDPALLRALPPEQARMLMNAQRNQGKLLALGDLSRQGIVKTASDIEGHALTLDPAMRDQYFASWRHFDPLEQLGMEYLKDHPRVHEAIPEMSNPELDLAAAHSVPTDVYNALFGQKGRAGERVTGVFSEPEMPSHLGQFSQRFLMRPFRAAIWARPQMVANIAVRGLIQALGQEGPEIFKPSNIIDAFHMRGDPTVAAGFRNLSTDQVHQLLGSATLGRILNTVPGAIRRVANNVSSIQRALVFVTEHDKMVAAGADEQTARMAGMQAIRESLVTHDNLTPIEQAVVRQVFPFYAYQKMLFQYLSRFPADHPFVTEVASKIGRQETELNSSGLPLMLQQMFQLGAPDKAGNIHSVDVRGFNPFRNFANDMTLTGIAMNANPALKLLMEAFGVNPAKGTPELYPGLTYNPQTGSLEATRPKIGPLQVAEAIIPQLGTVDAMIGFNNRLKYLKQTNPSAYRAMLFQTAGLPIPQTVNVPAETAHAEESLYRMSSTAVSNFLKTGDSGYISGYNLLPYSSRWWTPDQLEQWYNAQRGTIRQAQAQGPQGATSLKALLQPLPWRTAQLPPTG